MTEDKKNQNRTSGSKQQDQNMNRGDQTRNTSGQREQDQNPQRGSEWSNYRTREMSDEGYSGGNIQNQDGDEA